MGKKGVLSMTRRRLHTEPVHEFDPPRESGPWWCASCKNCAEWRGGHWICLRGCEVGFVQILPNKKTAEE